MKWRFFIRSGQTYHLLVSNENGGYYFDRNGNSYEGSSINNGWNTKYALEKIYWKEFEETSFEKALESIKSKIGQTNFLNILKIPRYQIVPLNDIIINKYLSILKENRAFNGDSAHTFNGNEETNNILYTMVEKGLIKSIGNNKFYLNE